MTICSDVVTEADPLEGTSNCTLELCFFFRNSALLLAFLLFVEGLTFFLVRASGRGAEAWLSLVSREKEKVELILREKLKALPWLANAWQKAKHCDAREESSPCSEAAVIFTSSSESKKSVEEHKIEHVAAFTFTKGKVQKKKT